MDSDREIVVYTRSTYCPYQRKAERVFEKHGLSPRTILIDRSAEAEQRVVGWTGYRSVPTIIVARSGEDLPAEPPAPLAWGHSPRGIDRGSMITEATEEQLEGWLAQHGFIDG